MHLQNPQVAQDKNQTWQNWLNYRLLVTSLAVMGLVASYSIFNLISQEQEQEQQQKKDLIEKLNSQDGVNSTKDDLYSQKRNKDIEGVKDVPLKYSRKFTVLQIEARTNNLKKLRDLIEVSDLNMADDQGYTHAHRAAINGHIEVLEFLAKNGADLNKADDKGCTPAYLAASNNRTEALEFLAKNGADLNKADNNEFTPTYVAALNGHSEVLKILAAYGADLNKVDDKGCTPAYLAASNNRTEVLEILAKNGADLNRTDNNEFTPTYLAAYKGHSDVLKILAAYGADLNKADDNEYTPANLAAMFGHSDALKVLIRNGADLNKASNNGFTPANSAALKGHSEALRILARNGADLNKANSFEDTPAHVAAFGYKNDKEDKQKFLKCLELLVEYKIDLRVKNEEGQTAWDMLDQSARDILSKINDQENSLTRHSKTSSKEISNKQYKPEEVDDKPSNSPRDPTMQNDINRQR